MFELRIGKPHCILRYILDNKVGRRWKINHLVPLKKSTKGKKYLVVAIEQITKWVEGNAVASDQPRKAQDFLSIK